MNPTELIEELKTELGAVAEVEVEYDIGVVSVVGMVLSRSPGVAARVFGALRNHNIKLITYGGSGVNLSLVVRDNEVPRAVQSLHQELCAKRTRSD
jgi:aspartate kinase